MSELADKAVDIEKVKELKRFVSKGEFLSYLVKRFCKEEKIE